MKCSVYCSLVLIVLLKNADCKKLKIPSYIKICKRNDPHLDQCISDSLNKMKPYLGIGIPEMRLHPFDPLTIARTGYKTQNLEAEFMDSEFHDTQNFILKDFHLDLEQNTLSMNISYDNLVTTGKYRLSGRILTFPLNGNGTFLTNYTRIDIFYKLTGKKILKHGKEYVDFESIDYHVKIGDFKTQMNNLFQDNPELTRNMNRIFNENSQSLIADYEEIARGILGEYMLGELRRVFRAFPLDELLPPN